MPALAMKEPAPAPGPGRWMGKGGESRLERLPRLVDAMTEAARALTESLGALAAVPSEVRFGGLATTRVDGMAGRRTPNAVFVLAQAAGWNTTVAFHFDPAFVVTVMQAMFGGCEDELELPERGALSPVETRIAQVLAGQAAEALTAGFAEILPSSFAVEPIRARPDLSRLGKPAAPVTVATFQVRMIGAPVEVDVLVPQAALDAFAAELSEGDEASRTDPAWSEKLEVEVNRARMKLQARLELRPMSLGEIAGLRVGQTLELPTGAAGQALMASGGTDLFRCTLGQANGRYSLLIEEDIALAGPSPHKDR